MTAAEEQIEALIQVARRLAADLDREAELMLDLATRRREIMVTLNTEYSMTVTAIAAELGLSVGRVSVMLRAQKTRQPEA